MEKPNQNINQSPKKEYRNFTNLIKNPVKKEKEMEKIVERPIKKKIQRFAS